MAGTIASVLKALNKGHFVIGAGASEDELENFGGYIDDVYIYNLALDAQAVKNIGKKQPAQNTLGTQEPEAKDKKKVYKVKGISYQILSKDSVSFQAPKKNSTKATIPAAVKIKGKTYKVTAIKAKACKDNKKLTSVTIGKNVKKIGAKAFYNCKKLKSIVIHTKKLTAGNVGTDAWKGLSAKVKITYPNEKKAAYKKIFQKKGLHA